MISLVVLRGIQIINKNPTMKKRLPIPIPEQLVVLIVSTLVVSGFKLDQAPHNVQIVGEIPSGLYTPALPPISVDRITTLLSPAITVAVVTYILTINVAKAVAAKNKLTVDANQEVSPGSTDQQLPNKPPYAMPAKAPSHSAICQLSPSLNHANPTVAVSSPRSPLPLSLFTLTSSLPFHLQLLALAAQSLVGGVTGSCVPSGSFSRTALITLMDAESPLHNLVSCLVSSY